MAGFLIVSLTAFLVRIALTLGYADSGIWRKSGNISGF